MGAQILSAPQKENAARIFSPKRKNDKHKNTRLPFGRRAFPIPGFLCPHTLDGHCDHRGQIRHRASCNRSHHFRSLLCIASCISGAFFSICPQYTRSFCFFNYFYQLSHSSPMQAAQFSAMQEIVPALHPAFFPASCPRDSFKKQLVPALFPSDSASISHRLCTALHFSDRNSCIFPLSLVKSRPPERISAPAGRFRSLKICESPPVFCRQTTVSYSPAPPSAK